MPRTSAGILLYREADPLPEVLIVHPGGPLWKSKDDGAWSVPKGEYTDEDPRACALRELAEELGPAGPQPDPASLIDLGQVRQAGGKLVRAWAAKGDFDPAELASNTYKVKLRSGAWRTYPEVDRAEWHVPETAKRKLNPAQAAFVDRLLERLGRA